MRSKELVKKINLVVSMFLLATTGLWAHGVHHSVTRDEAVIVNAMYDGNEPMAYAGVKIYSPADSEVEYQNARVDKNGKFAFYPNQKGEWTIKVNDGMGHGFTEKVEVKNISEAGHTHSHGNLTTTHKVIMTICIVWGFAGFYFYFKSRQPA